MTDRAEIEALVDRYVDAIARQDIEAAVACFAEEAQQEDPVGTPARTGLGIREFFEMAFGAPATLTREGETLIGRDYASFRFSLEITTPEPLVIRVADLIRVENGLIAHIWAVQDLG